jgi:hypothetical protein
VRCAAIKEVVEAAPQGFAIDRHMTPTLGFGSIIQDAACPTARCVRREVAESTSLHDDPWYSATA